VFVVYDPRLLAGVAVAGMGAAALGGPSAGAAKGMSEVLDWGERAAADYERLPHKVLVTVARDDVRVFRWPVAARPSALLTLHPGEFTAEVRTHHWYGQCDLRLKITRRSKVLLSGKSGVIHHSAARCAAAVMIFSERS